MRLILGVLVGGGLGAYIGYLLVPDISIGTAIVGAFIGTRLTRARKQVVGDGDWYDGSDEDDWGGDD